MKKIKRMAIIPARSGSKRIINKNIKKFHSKPIIFYSIENSLKSRLFYKIHISTNSHKIKNMVEKKSKSKVDFLRPKSLSDDSTSLLKVLKFVLLEYKKKGQFFDEVWLIYACSPLVSYKDFIGANMMHQ